MLPRKLQPHAPRNRHFPPRGFILLLPSLLQDWMVCGRESRGDKHVPSKVKITQGEGLTLEACQSNLGNGSLYPSEAHRTSGSSLVILKKLLVKTSGEQSALSLSLWPPFTPFVRVLSCPGACNHTTTHVQWPPGALGRLRGLQRTMKQKLQALGFILALLKKGETFSMVGRREVRHGEARKGNSLILSQINHAAPQSPLHGSLKCFSQDPVEELVPLPQH